MSDGGQAVNGVPGKSADGLGDDKVDLPGQCIRHHGLEALTMLGAGAGDALIGVHLHEFPVIPRLNVLGVVVDLRFIAGELLIAVRGDAGVGSDPALFLSRDG